MDSFLSMSPSIFLSFIYSYLEVRELSCGVEYTTILIESLMAYHNRNLSNIWTMNILILWYG